MKRITGISTVIVLAVLALIAVALIGSGFASSDNENKFRSANLQPREPNPTKTPTPRPTPTQTVMPSPTPTIDPKVGGIAELNPDLVGVVEGTYTYTIDPVRLTPTINFTLKNVSKNTVVGYAIVYRFESDQGRSFDYNHAVPPGRFVLPPKGQITSKGEPGSVLQNPSSWTITVKVISVTFQ